MKFSTRCVFAVVAGLCVAFSTGASRAQDASLAVVPSDAPIVVQVNGLEKARNRLGKFLGNALPDIAPKLGKQIDDGIKELAEGRDLKSINKDGRIYVAVMDLTSLPDDARFTILIPVSSYKEFKDSFLKDAERKSLKKEGDGVESVKIEDKDDPLYLVERKEYVAITNDTDVAKNLAKATDAGLGKTLSAATAKAFLDRDVAVYANLKVLNKQFGAKVRGFRALFDILPQGVGIDKSQIELAKKMFDAMLSLFDDGVAAVLGIDVRPEGGNLHFSAQFGSDTETNDFLKKLTPAALAPLGSLPGGQIMYTASNFDTALSKTWTALMREALASDEDEDAKKGIDNALQELSGNGRVIDLAAFKSLAGGLSISEYKDGGKAVASTLKLFKSLSKTGSFGNIPLKDKPDIKENAQTIGDVKFNEVKLSFDFDKAVEKLPDGLKEATKASMMKMAGEKTTVWFGNSGNKFIQVSAKDWKDAKAAIEEYLKGANPLDKDESFVNTRKQLPADATILALGDSARMVEGFLELMKESLAGLGGAGAGLPIGNIPELKAPKGKPAYFGMAIVMKAEYVQFDLFVPVTAVQQIRKMFAPLIDGDN